VLTINFIGVILLDQLDSD